MPGGDRTGPLGQGSMTGRRMGFCTGSENTSFAYGRGCRQGRGYGFRAGFQNVPFKNLINPISNTQAQISEKTLIENDISVLKEQLQYLEKRLSKVQENTE